MAVGSMAAGNWGCRRYPREQPLATVLRWAYAHNAGAQLRWWVCGVGSVAQAPIGVWQSWAQSYWDRKSHTQWTRIYMDGLVWEVDTELTSRPQPCVHRQSGHRGGQRGVSTKRDPGIMSNADSQARTAGGSRNQWISHVKQLSE